jgi:hypothetical protein
MRHHVYSWRRREVSVADATLLDRAADPADTDSRADGDLILTGFSTLNCADQEILLMLDVHELRPAEVGSRLGLRPSAVSMRATRARDALAEAYLVAHTRPGDSTHCERVRRDYGRYVRGRLSAGCARRVKAHLATCPRCSAVVVELSDVNRALRGLPIFTGIGASTHGIGRFLPGLHGLHGGSHAGTATIATKIGVAAATVGLTTTAGFVIAAAANRPIHPGLDSHRRPSAQLAPQTPSTPASHQQPSSRPARKSTVASSILVVPPPPRRTVDAPVSTRPPSSVAKAPTTLDSEPKRDPTPTPAPTPTPTPRATPKPTSTPTPPLTPPTPTPDQVEPSPVFTITLPNPNPNPMPMPWVPWVLS